MNENINDIDEDEEKEMLNEIKKEGYFTEVDSDDIINSIKLKDDDDETNDEIEEDEIEKPKKEKPKKEEIVVSSETMDLYNEFSSFLETKAEIKQDLSERLTIATGIDLLDAILGGGFGVGALSIIVGQPGAGKSILAAQVMANSQKQYKNNLIAAYLDSEEATSMVRLANLGVVNPKVKPYVDITIEKVFKFLEGTCLFKESKKILNDPSIIIWDSIANTLSEKEREAKDVNQVIGYKARLLSILVPKYVSKCAKHNICFLAVNQLRDVLSMGPYGPPRDLKMMSHTKDMPGGTVLKYNAFQLVEMKVKTVFGQDDKYGFDGFISKVKCVKNKLFTPNIEIQIVGSFIHGFSNFWTNYNFLVDTKRLKAGSWNSLVTNPEIKFRTKDALDKYETEPEFKEIFDKNVKEAINTDIFEKYNPSI